MVTSTKVALVTGAAQGIGAAVARVLAGSASIAALDIQEERLAALVGELREQGAQAAAFQADVSDSTSVERAVEAVE